MSDVQNCYLRLRNHIGGRACGGGVRSQRVTARLDDLRDLKSEIARLTAIVERLTLHIDTISGELQSVNEAVGEASIAAEEARSKA